MLYTTNLNLKKPESTDTVNVEDFNGNADILDAALQGKVDKAAGKGLSQEDYTTAEKTKLAGIAAGANQYVHPNHTGDVTSNGDGVTAIAPGVIVNADINASAAIDATKIADGTVDNAEFGYLNGVTGPIQSQLDAKSAVSDYIRQPGYAAATGSANVYAVTLSPALAAYAAGVCVAVKINVANTGASTLNVNGLGAKAILDSKGNAMTAGKLKADSIYTLRYNGTAFIVQGDGPDEASDILGKIKTVDGAGSGLDADTVRGNVLRHFHQPDNWGLESSAPSAYSKGQTMFFVSADVGAHGFPNTYGTVVVIKGFADASVGAIQYFYPYNQDVPIRYRYGIYPANAWTEWRTLWDSSSLRIIAGNLEMNDGTGWKPVGGNAYYSSSDSVLESDATERTTTASSPAGVLVYKFTPKFNGEIKVTADIRQTGGNGSVRANLFAYVSAGTTDAKDFAALNTSIPIGTALNFGGLSGYGGIGSTLTNLSTTYTSVGTTYLVTAGKPIFLVLNSNDGSTATSVYVRNIAIKGTIVRY
ncbi:hypothetical protein [Cohnella panacarvi]|uniref:hypothetical protein n=1 Tax=Cohnella panacarvi TaxID=400776 RepID=UPI00047A395C|nr:hypothetical protein [Cohnella panacarvi]